MKSSKRVLFLGGMVGLCCLMAICLGGMALAIANRQTIAFGVTFDGKALGGMSKQEAQHFLAQAAQKELSKPAAQFTYEQQEWDVSPQEISLTADIDATTQKAYDIGHNGTFTENLMTQLDCMLHGRSVQLETSYDDQALQTKLSGMAATINRQPVNAACRINADGSVRHIPGQIGKQLDVQETANEVSPSLLALDLPVRLELKPKDLAPFVQDADLEHIDSVLASYTTYFSSSANRVENIRIAASQLDGVLITTGSEASFNTIVGPRTAERGYRTAGVISNGQFTQDIGGGVCQVSSTLYNAILLAGLEPTVRSSHSFPSTYISAGLDATVADGQIDLKFRNPLPHNVYLLSSSSGSDVTFYVLGTRADLNGSTISLHTTLEKAGPGPIVSAYRVYRQNGQVVEDEYLHTDHYDVPKL